jgi:hypothetical protein
MNNATTNLTAIVAIFMAATLVLGTFVTVAVPLPAFAIAKKRGQDGSKKTRDNGSDNSNKNGNTVTIEKCKDRGFATGFDTSVTQECENLICTYPANNASCSQEGTISAPIPTPPTPTIKISGQGEGENFCPRATISIPASITFSVQQNVGGAVQGQFNVDVHFIIPFTKTGTLNGLHMSGDGSFTVTGTELSQTGAAHCSFSHLPTSSTITGQCGTGVTIKFATADGEHATFTGNVVCT